MQEAKIILDGKDYPLEQFSENVRKLVGVRQVWAQQLEEDRLSVTKTELALQSLDAQLTTLVKAELESVADVKAE